MVILWGMNTKHIPFLQRTILGSKLCGSWFHIFDIRLHFNEDFQLNLSDKVIRLLMSKFIRFWHLSSTDAVSLNIIRMHKKVIHKSDIILCNGKTIKAEMLTGSPGHSDSHKFPTQCPTSADLAI